MENKTIHGYVYLITNLINGKQYVGQTVLTIEERFKIHYDESRRKNCKMVIDRAINKYGKENFKRQEIAVAYTQKQLNFSEGFYMKSFNTLSPNGYNIKEIIDGKGKHSEETKEKMRIKAKINSNRPERIKISSENGKKHRGIGNKKSTSKFVGVRFYGKKYIASIGYLHKLIHIGSYNLESDAAKAYDIEAIKLYGYDCVLNFPELRDAYIQNKVSVEKNKQYIGGHGISGEKYIKFNKTHNTWQFKWYSKTLNKNKYKNFKTLEDAINFKKEKILDEDYSEFKYRLV